MKPHASRFAIVLVLGLAACGAEPPPAEPQAPMVTPAAVETRPPAPVVERSIPPTPDGEALDQGTEAPVEDDAIPPEDGGAAATEAPVAGDGARHRDAREATEEAALRIFDAAQRLHETGRDVIQTVRESVLDGEASEIETHVE